MDHWVLDGHDAVPATLEEWSHWFGKVKNERVVRQDTLTGNVRVSTVFLGIDHGWGVSPLIFETMVFTDDKDDHWEQYTRRYATWDEAEAGHYATVAAIVYEMEKP